MAATDVCDHCEQEARAPCRWLRLSTVLALTVTATIAACSRIDVYVLEAAMGFGGESSCRCRLIHSGHDNGHDVRDGSNVHDPRGHRATFTSAATSNELVQGLTPTNIKFTFTSDLVLNPIGTGAADVADTITITTTSADAVFVDNKVPACTSLTAGTVTALTSGGAGKILTFTVTAQIAAGAHTFTCTNGGVGAIAANPTAGAITFTMVTTQDTITSGAATYTTRDPTSVVWGSATSYNQLTEGIAPIKHRFIFTPSSDGVLNTGTAGAARCIGYDHHHRELGDFRDGKGPGVHRDRGRRRQCCNDIG